MHSTYLLPNVMQARGPWLKRAWPQSNHLMYNSACNSCTRWHSIAQLPWAIRHTTVTSCSRHTAQSSISTLWLCTRHDPCFNAYATHMTRPLLQTRATYVLTHPTLRWHRYKSGHHRYATEAIDIAPGRCNGTKTCWFKLRRPNATKFSSLGSLVRCSSPALCIANIEVSVSLSTLFFQVLFVHC
jgi:hypothetical protein